MEGYALRIALLLSLLATAAAQGPTIDAYVVPVSVLYRRRSAPCVLTKHATVLIPCPNRQSASIRTTTSVCMFKNEASIHHWVHFLWGYFWVLTGCSPQTYPRQSCRLADHD